jgi:hypothetical protein
MGEAMILVEALKSISETKFIVMPKKKKIEFFHPLRLLEGLPYNETQRKVEIVGNCIFYFDENNGIWGQKEAGRGEAADPMYVMVDRSDLEKGSDVPA